MQCPCQGYHEETEKVVADDIRSIFYASSRQKAMEFFATFKDRWEREFPSAVKYLENSLDACLRFFHFPEEQWISLRTTNIIERLNKECKCRTKPMEIVAGKNACYMLPAFVSIKMELHWRSNPIGKVRKNLPFFKELDSEAPRLQGGASKRNFDLMWGNSSPTPPDHKPFIPVHSTGYSG